MCVHITCKWLLPSFAFKYQQTQQKIRNPLWFKDFLKEWTEMSKTYFDPVCSNTDIKNWTCSCIKYQNSLFYLCEHLVVESKKTVKYRSEIKIQDQHPFLLFGNSTSHQVDSILMPENVRMFKYIILEELEFITGKRFIFGTQK
jgi:hypothetical protein